MTNAFEELMLHYEEEDEDNMYPWIGMNQIEEHLYLGDRSSSKCSHIRDHNITLVVTVTEWKIPFHERVETVTYQHIPAYDMEGQDLLTYFPFVCQLIDDFIAGGGNVLVHCLAGMSRSATFVVSYVMQKYKMSVQSAIAFVKSKRGIICPNEDFMKQLALFEEMNFTLDPMNERLRHHLIRCHAIVVGGGPPLLKYFERRSLVEGMHPNMDFGQQYDCSNCGHKLFNEIHMRGRGDEKPQNDCLAVEVEPQEWMCDQLAAGYDPGLGYGLIGCPNCDEIKAKSFRPNLKIEMSNNSYQRHR